ncbi:MAG: RagB/SusD family nutrient uptake outer membrane protein [Dysgonamonadaceae bacterium]|jgi:hypothetical protein|nr:RagB/SusD family nutrient uptake outer membrane protein [Dysgonamonadaceae bacterium]
MKKYIYIVIFAVLGLTLNSCDLETSPSTAADDTLVFSSVENVDRVLNGTWRYIMETYSTWANPGWASLLLTSEAMGSDAVVRNAYGFYNQYTFQATNQSNNGTVAHIWALAYRAIDNMNHIITKIDDVPGDTATKNRIKAQAYALRGYMYLNLGTFFVGKYSENANNLAVPIYTTPTDGSAVGNARETLSRVMKQAEDDLLAAHGLIGSWSHGTAKHKITRNIISGILARLYLQREDWADAAKFAAEAETNYNWMPQADYLLGFNDLGNAEWIWAHGQTTDQNNIHISYLDVTLSSTEGYANFMADPFFMGLFDEDDVRTQLFQWNTTHFPGFLMYKKFRQRPNTTADQVLMRKAEMVLIQAEALAGQNLLPGAIAKLNELRNARGAQTPDLSTLSQAELVEEILIERRKELFGEGFALSDIKRRGKSVVRRALPDGMVVPGTEILARGHNILQFPNGTPFVANSPFYDFTFPVTETDRNPNWKN